MYYVIQNGSKLIIIGEDKYFSVRNSNTIVVKDCGTDKAALKEKWNIN